MILQKEIYGVDHMLDVLGLHQDTSRAKHQRGAEVLGRMVAAHFFFRQHSSPRESTTAD